MRSLINILLLALAVLFGYFLVNSIKEPITFKSEYTKRKTAVQAKLMEIRKAQQMYYSIEGHYAKSFSDLEKTLTNKDFRYISVYGDPDDPNNTDLIRRDTTYRPAIDSIRAMGMDLSKLAHIPYSDNKEFDIIADTVTYKQILIDVVKVGTPMTNFMGKYADIKYQKYDNLYDPENRLEFGNLNKPSLAGNW